MSKGKYIVRVVNQPLIKLVGRVKEKKVDEMAQRNG